MQWDSGYLLEASGKTRNLGLIVSLVLLPVVSVFAYIDSITPILHGIFGWRIGAIIPALLFLLYALFLFPSFRSLAIPFHAVQLFALMIMMCGITADLATRPDFPAFGRTGLISSLLVCIFADFAFAGGARSFLPAILFPPLAAMSAYLIVQGHSLTETERIWIISNPTAMAVVLSVLAVYQERLSVREFKARSELKRAESALRASENKYRALFENAEVGMFQIRRKDLQIIDVNRKCLEITGRTRQEMIGTSSLVHWTDPREHEEVMQVLAREGHVKNLESRIVNVGGQERNCLVSLSLLPEQEVIEGSLIDITERKMLEAERLDLERRVAASQRREGLGVLAGGIAHNFNNLLMIILGHAELLRGMLSKDSVMAASVLEISKAGERSRDLIDRLLTMGRRRPEELRPLDLNAVIGGCRAMLRQAVRENILIDYQLSAFPCPVAADPGRIEEILLNLALNAQDAIPREGRIEIATTEVVPEGRFTRRSEDVPPGRHVLLQFSDTGQGMTREVLENVFTPFFTTKEQSKGTGLGLYTVYGIVKQHNGTIEVESNPGGGTRFLIHFPRIEASAEERQTQNAVHAAEGREGILLVEDEAPIRRMLSHHLRGLGYKVFEAPDGISAQEVFAKNADKIHLLVTDVVMPRMSGTDLYDRLRQRFPDLKALFMSGYPEHVISKHTAKDGKIEVMTKPFTGEALAAQIREILG